MLTGVELRHEDYSSAARSVLPPPQHPPSSRSLGREFNQRLYSIEFLSRLLAGYTTLYHILDILSIAWRAYHAI